MKQVEQIALEKENETLRVRLRNRNRELIETRTKFTELAEKIQEEMENEYANKCWKIAMKARKNGVSVRELSEIMECTENKVMHKTSEIEEIDP